MSAPIAEAVLQRLILARLNLLPGVKVWRSNTGARQVAGGRVIRFGVRGQGDISGVGPNGIRIEVEVKTATGRLTPDQLAFGELMKKHGAVYVVARSLEDALAAVAPLTNSGRAP